MPFHLEPVVSIDMMFFSSITWTRITTQYHKFRARAKITLYCWQILKTKNLEIVHYDCLSEQNADPAIGSQLNELVFNLIGTPFALYNLPSLNLGAKNVKLFLREP